MKQRLLPILLLLLGVARATACNVPVFRFALERWPCAPYELTVFFDAGLDPAGKNALDQLRSWMDDPLAAERLVITLVDLSRPLQDEHLAKMHATRKNSPLPWMILRFPEGSGIGALHEGPLDLQVLGRFRASPVRREIARRMLSGDSVVWVFLETADRAENETRFALLEQSLADLQAKLKLPKLTDAPKDRLLRNDIPLQIRFSVVRLKRDDPAEAEFVRMLLRTEPDLEGLAEPMAFPIFGRGIALYALVGKGITRDNVEEAGRFLVGACSCEVRKLNPGVDLLFDVDWNGTAADVREPASAEAAATSPAPRFDHALWRNLVWVFGGLLGTILIGSMLLFARRKEDRP